MPCRAEKTGFLRIETSELNHVLFGCFLSENPLTFAGVEPEKIYENAEVL